MSSGWFNPIHQKVAMYAFEHGYRVEPDGRVLSCRGDGKYLKLQPRGSDGYLSFSVHYRGSKKTLSVHLLAAYQKYGKKIFEPNIQIRHLNGDKSDNSWDNLAIGTQRDNQMDIPKEVRVARCRTGVRNAALKARRLADVEVKRLRADREAGATYKTLMARYGLSKTAVSFIVNRHTYQEVRDV